MNNIAIFNQIFLSISLFYLIFLFLRYFNKAYFMFSNLKYTTIKDVVTQAALTLTIILITSWLFKEGYHILGTSELQLKDYKDDPLIAIFVIVTANVATIMVLGSLKTAIDFLRKLRYYLVLKKDNIPNRLRHALYKKDYNEIITYYKLYIKSNESISLSKEETLTLSACLSKAGLNNDLDKLLEQQLYKPVSLLNTIFSSSISSTFYNLQLNNSNFIYTENLKRELIKRNKFFKTIYTFIILIASIQFCIVISQLFIPTTTVSRITIILIGIFIVGIILFKYMDLKRIYNSHAKNTMIEFPNKDKVIIKKSSTDKVLLSAQAIMIITSVIGLLMV
ncbi:TPA: hypothetical protein KED73_002676 [Staphylococcus aureus]|nr:hypothetical protein [Staphylococcus aureus]